MTFVKGDYELEKIKEWDTMGMRGTCSPGFVVRATCAPARALRFVPVTWTIVPGVPLVGLMLVMIGAVGPKFRCSMTLPEEPPFPSTLTK